ncbi:chemotaxis protein CheB [Clostridium beijerinckii]|uniref:protein-glutamate methylesterase n=1 Tax=Clostridium beijerinckii TaxID=1520 RepID=A0AAX0AYF1_CLOBE|nr:chemotaxis protein CheB [Clostridium beijerinckii]MBA8934748.1 two-component system chemotaxis response regulator CheB [Clostridium beijerinckii]NRT87498.1 two-component system chemotaxis response regulator CheB [Clostridium beijerinckii]NRU39146.1 two-component system chemotaxis response regulator CheB [Clostridium beijerinckii]NSA97575.1 two-component system chemotaxis response regulator CheB [Clostridium beijerinckii]NYC72928.1 two-component system chemotaxis response regulator CheB [Clo
MKYRAIVIGASAGGMDAIKEILLALPINFAAPVIIVQHLNSHSNGYIIKYLKKLCKINVKEADEKEGILPGNVYIAPPNYHLLVEKDETLSLTVDNKENYSRPSVDVLFESAAEVYRYELIGIILTGANRDGSNGLRRIKELGGVTIVQDPDTAEVYFMPKSAINTTEVDYILTLDKINAKIIELVGESNETK